MYDFAFDSRTGVLRVRGVGFLSEAEAIAYVAASRSHVDRIRASGRCLRVLIDAREGDVQAPHVNERLGRNRMDMVRGLDDRLAIVVASSLLAMQVKRTFESERMGVFTALDAAERWLAESLPAPVKHGAANAGPALSARTDDGRHSSNAA